MKVTAFQMTDGGCDFYRSILPVFTAAKKGALEATKVFAEAIPATIMYDRDKFNRLMDCDIYQTQRVMGTKFIKRIQEVIKEHNPRGRVVMDMDDNIFAVSPLSGHYADYGTKEVKIKFQDGSEHWAWKDGKNMNIAVNTRRLEEAKKALGMADMVTTTTEVLAKVLRQHSDNVVVLPNCVDLNTWEPLPLKKTDEVRLLWAGGMSHWEDMAVIREALSAILERHKNAKLVIVGWMPEGFEETYKGRVEFHEWVDTLAYPYFMAGLNADIGLIPLHPTEFSACKSPIKWIEQASLGIPSVVSGVEPYLPVEALSEKDCGVFVDDNSTEAWVGAVSMLIDSPSLRHEIGTNARSVVAEHFDINTQYKRWVIAFKEVLACPFRQTQHSIKS